MYLVANVSDVLVVKVVEAFDEAIGSSVQRYEAGLISGDVAVLMV